MEWNAQQEFYQVSLQIRLCCNLQLPFNIDLLVVLHCRRNACVLGLQSSEIAIQVQYERRRLGLECLRLETFLSNVSDLS
jgi:hypothetical protein